MLQISFQIAIKAVFVIYRWVEMPKISFYLANKKNNNNMILKYLHKIFSHL